MDQLAYGEANPNDAAVQRQPIRLQLVSFASLDSKLLHKRSHGLRRTKAMVVEAIVGSRYGHETYGEDKAFIEVSDKSAVDAHGW